jgi:tetratricopeptide (TPR) repeat protein
MDKKKDKKPAENNRITPADIKLSHSADGSHYSKNNRADKRGVNALIWFSLGALIIIAGGVIFVLPNLTGSTNSSTIIAQKDSPSGVSTTTTRQSRPEVSPWSEAQLAKMRKETQDVLAELLKQQETLEEMNVEQWAESEYTRALQAAEQGDADYREREFEGAQINYQIALDIFQNLYQQSEDYYNSAMDSGGEALGTGDSEAANQSFQSALLIKPGDADAIKGFQRSESLDEVFNLIRDAEDYLENSQLDDARSSLQSALEQDPDTEIAKAQLKEVNNRITNREFNNAMTRGYAALDAREYEKARDAFSRAGKIKPNVPEVNSAMAQTNDRLTSIKINQLLSAADEHSVNEDWLSAIHAYDQALALDKSLNNAQEGREQAQWRNNLDKRLTMAIAKPERLSNNTVHKEATSILNEARSIRNSGMNLKRQIAVLSVMLEESMTPTLVIIRSNTETDVTLYRVGELGQFDRKEIELKPGAYVAVGKRENYRDVRVEFTIIANKTPPPITIQCEEKIARRN